MKVIGFALAGSVLALTLTGCTKNEERKVLRPESPKSSSQTEVAEAHWLGQGPDLLRTVQFASASPLVRRALVESPQPNLRFVSDAAIVVVGQGTDGARYQATILPYADPRDPNRATFLSLVARDGALMCQRSELLASVTRVSPDSGYAPVTVLGRTLYLREGAPYVPQSAGSAQLSPERFNKIRFMACFMTGLPLVGKISEEVCSGLPEIPQCTAVTNTVGTAGLAIGCGIWAFGK